MLTSIRPPIRHNLPAKCPVNSPGPNAAFSRSTNLNFSWNTKN